MPLITSLEVSPVVEFNFKVSDVVVSLAFGIGKIVAIEQLAGHKGFFYLIQSVDKNMKTMVPVKSLKGLRLLSERHSFMTELDRLGQFHSGKSYSTKKDRILHFKERSDANSLQDLAELIRELNSLTDRGSIENKLLADLQSFLAKEYAFLFQITQEEAFSTVVQKCKA